MFLFLIAELYINMPLFGSCFKTHFFTFTCSWNILRWNKPLRKLVSNNNRFFCSRIWNLARAWWDGLTLLHAVSPGAVWLKAGRPAFLMVHSHSWQVAVGCWLGAQQDSWVGTSVPPYWDSMGFLAPSQHGGLVPKTSNPRKPDKNYTLVSNLTL